MNINQLNDPLEWAAAQWGQAQLGDLRRNARAIQIGADMACQPEGSLPEQMGSWSNLKAAYRLLAQADVTHTALSQPHWRATQIEAKLCDSSVVLFVQDLSQLDYTSHINTANLGHIGDGGGRGLMVHSCLAIVPTAGNPEILGLAAQQVWTRSDVKRGQETRTERSARRTEFDVWAEVVESIGVAPDSTIAPMWVSVGDRGSDIFSYVRPSIAQNWHCLLRVCQDRVIQTIDGSFQRLKSFARSLPVMSHKKIVLRGRSGQPKRHVELQLAWQQVQIHPPRQGPERQQQPIKGWCIRCWEANASPNQLEWILFTTVPVTDVESVRLVVDWYTCRWVIEEYHKCLKTGCGLEKRQLTTADGLKRLLGFLALVAVRLLQLRHLSRNHPQRLASKIVPHEMLKVLVALFGLSDVEQLTMLEFWRAVATLGGFIGPQSDGEPGWQTLWRGWQRLQDICWGAAIAAKS
jgi:Transposase DNA-binding/Transposase DDE domain